MDDDGTIFMSFCCVPDGVKCLVHCPTSMTQWRPGGTRTRLGLPLPPTATTERVPAAHQNDYSVGLGNRSERHRIANALPDTDGTKEAEAGTSVATRRHHKT